MLFAWQGLLFEHPTDWAPLTLSGNRTEGYARIVAPDRGFLQLRWQLGKSVVSSDAVARYLERLRKDARKDPAGFSCKQEEKNGQISYSYQGRARGKGLLFPAPDGRGVLFLEAVDSPQSVLTEAKRTFKVQDGTYERWALHGLDMRLPRGLKVDSHELKAGKTVLQLSGLKMRVVGERWGFAEQLLSSQTLAKWVCALTGLPEKSLVDSETDDGRVSLQHSRSMAPPVSVKAAAQLDKNQITVIRVETRLPNLRPEWDWFA